MGWLIECNNPECGEKTWATQIDDLMRHHRNGDGRFRCSACRGSGRIRKEHQNMQSRNEAPWCPQLVGAIQPDWFDANPNCFYQPFAFVLETEEDGPGVWMRYYKDTRNEPGGRLKFGDGPGGGPVFSPMDLVDLVAKLTKLGLLERDTVRAHLDR